MAIENGIQEFPTPVNTCYQHRNNRAHDRQTKEYDIAKSMRGKDTKRHSSHVLEENIFLKDDN